MGTIMSRWVLLSSHNVYAFGDLVLSRFRRIANFQELSSALNLTEQLFSSIEPLDKDKFRNHDDRWKVVDFLRGILDHFVTIVMFHVKTPTSWKLSRKASK